MCYDCSCVYGKEIKISLIGNTTDQIFLLSNLFIDRFKIIALLRILELLVKLNELSSKKVLSCFFFCQNSTDNYKEPFLKLLKLLRKVYFFIETWRALEQKLLCEDYFISTAV